LKGSRYEEDRATELIERAKKSSLSYTGQIGNGSYFLSLANDVNAATLKRLAPKSGSNHRDLRSLIVFDWDDTLFPTTYFWRRFPDQSEFQETAKAAAALLRAARQLGDVVIVTLATEDWVRQCIDIMGDDEFSEEVAQVRILYAREIQDTVQVCPRLNLSYEDVAQNVGALLCSSAWDPELRAHLVNAKMATMQSGLPLGCEQVISIGDSEIERWAVHDLPFASSENLALLKTIKFEESLGCAALAQMLRTTASFLGQFVRLNVEMDVDLSSGDALFPMDLQFAMQAASRSQDLEETPPRGAHAGRPAAKWRSHEL
jgi:hypothetical protein